MDDSNVFKLMLAKAIKSEPLAFTNFDRTKNVQDQLQEMISTSPRELMNALLKWESLFGHFYYSSMEQLWLAFYMSEKHNKYWSGTEWQLKK